MPRSAPPLALAIGCRAAQRASGRGRALVGWLALCLLFSGSAAFATDPAEVRTALIEGDRLWEGRAETLDGRLALPEKVEGARAAYLDSIDVAGSASSSSSTIEARWKALRAAHYLSEFTTAPEARRARAIGEATRLAEESIDRLARSAGGSQPAELAPAELEAWLRTSGLDRKDVAQLHFWSAIVWGAHGQRVGLITIVREGIARRMYEDASLALRLDRTIERGGAFRLLSRLNADLPRVPFISGWVDREKALPQAERAFAIDPEDPGNQVILALALRDFAPDRRIEAERLLERAAAALPRPGLRAEDLAIAEEARDALSALRAARDR